MYRSYQGTINVGISRDFGVRHTVYQHWILWIHLNIYFLELLCTVLSSNFIQSQIKSLSRRDRGEWCNGETTNLPPMWPRFELQSWRQKITLVEFVIGSLPCSERFFCGVLWIPLLKNQHFQIPIWSGIHRNISTCSYELLLTAPLVNNTVKKLHKILVGGQRNDTSCNITWNDIKGLK